MARDQTLLSGCVPAFARHNGYPPRWGWPVKVHAALREDTQAFARAKAPGTLGVGSSIVAPMRFWSLAFGLIRQDERACGGPRPVCATGRGHWLLEEEEGADPYLEEAATLWLLHWWLLSAQPCHVPTFRYLFGIWGRSRFARAELQAAVQDAAVATGWSRPADRRIQRDITALVSMYGTTGQPDRPSAHAVEEYVSNPFRQLGLLELAAAEAHFGEQPRTTRPSDRDLRVNRHRGTSCCPRAILAYACLQYAQLQDVRAPGAIALGRLHTDPVGPGRLLLADRRALRTALEQVEVGPTGRGVRLAASGDGEELLAFTEPPGDLADRLLAARYRRLDGPASQR
ncbi:DUF4007 family protein [Streptomyces armeniacus]|uniref:DUF4007 family protein n=1 Tax=Streptomyces armeniacus TaxID=83291 RepID=A0A345XVX6_9ACTN|nr:DUF4007 family protein [Streptomyces armeniacus]AXK35792.1 DUF4007 family protein [Streptomyces armeniacus]